MINIESALGFMFQIAGLLTAILFSVYCFCIVSSNEFIVRIRHTHTFLRSKNYIKGTFSLGLFITILSLFAASFSLPEGYQEAFFYVLIALMVWWLYRFIKCYRMFDTISSVT